MKRNFLKKKEQNGIVGGEIIGPKSYKNDVYPHYFQNYWPKPKNLNTSTPKPQTRDIGEPFYGNGPTESPK